MPDFLNWQSPLTLEHVFSSVDAFSYPASYQDGFIYLTQLKNEKNRSVLMFSNGDDTQCITPTPYNLRTRISEYGGKSFWLFGDELFFCNQSDQCLYRQKISIKESKVYASPPERITAKASNDAVFMYSDVIKLTRSKLLAIVEVENLSSDIENQSYIAIIDLNDKEKAPVIVEQGADFYSNLVFSEPLNSIAWVEWQHPLMPWDANELYVAQIQIENDNVSVTDKKRIEFGKSASVCQLLFSSSGKLFFSADFSDNVNDASPTKNYWNVYCCDFGCVKNRDAESHPLGQYSLLQVTHETLEFGYPHWQYGDSRIVELDQETLLTVGSAPTGDYLFLIDQATLKVIKVLESDSTIQSLFSRSDGSALMIELPKVDGARLLQLSDFDFNSVEFNGFASKVLLENKVSLKKENISQAQHFEFNSRDGASVYGFYYPPVNTDFDKSEASIAPPLIVMVHGGPTARAYGHFDIQKQFWTSRGFALFDVNHRGSSGYGRSYRDALYGHWGDLDCSDIIDGIEHLISTGKADKQRICIRGKSAGGYAVLRALTQYPTVFRAGACYYGIGNLATLAQTTHKFEKHYTDRLIGEPYNENQANKPESRFYKRSPIHDISKLKSAMIVFQGLKDKVVPPEVAYEVVSVLKKEGVDHEYVEYKDEAHGFRQVNNNIDAWTKELAFYRRILAS